MSHRLRHSPPTNIEMGSKDAHLEIPTMTLSYLVSMVAIAKWVVCDHDAMINPGFRRAVQFMEQSVDEQAYAQAGSDEIWKDPQDGSYHHPTFPEQDGDAWEVIGQYNEEVFKWKLIEYASELYAERDGAEGADKEECRNHYEHVMQDIVEQWGCKALVKSLMT